MLDTTDTYKFHRPTLRITIGYDKPRMIYVIVAKPCAKILHSLDVQHHSFVSGVKVATILDNLWLTRYLVL